MNWMENFGEDILKRGHSYYKNDNVKIINSDSKHLEARVRGGNDYNVRIKFKDGEISSMNCDCYFNIHEGKCKHLAATLYYLDEHKELLKNNDIKSILNSMSNEDIHKFLLTELERDYNLLAKFNIFNNINTDKEYYLNKIIEISKDENYFSKTMDFVDNDLEFLFENEEYELIFEIIKILWEFIKYHVRIGDFYGDNDLVYVFSDLVFKLSGTSVDKELKEYLKSEFDENPCGLEFEIENIALRVMEEDELFD